MLYFIEFALLLKGKHLYWYDLLKTNFANQNNSNIKRLELFLHHLIKRSYDKNKTPP